jgi:CRISPR/Cas system-associated endonuclease/helicase Cas3
VGRVRRKRKSITILAIRDDDNKDNKDDNEDNNEDTREPLAQVNHKKKPIPLANISNVVIIF